MKSTSLFLLLLLSFSAQAQTSPALHPAGPNRPASVPANYVITPFGYFHPSCVLQLRKGESVSKDGVLHHADGSEAKVEPCQFPHFDRLGAPAAAAPANAAPGIAAAEPAAPVQPTIGHSWIENVGVTTTLSYSKEVSTWTVPPVPLMHDGQTIFLFPGFEDLGDPNTSILQPVIGSYDGTGWTMASWNCCIAGTADESTDIAINAGDTIVGTSEMTCSAGTTSCATWNVITADQTTNQSTELTATPSDGQTFNWAFGGVLEVYNLDQCLDYPPNASITFTNTLYDSNLVAIATPDWVSSGPPPTSLQPQCNYGATSTATTTTLVYGTTAPSFGLGISPAAGIAVNQGSSATGTLTTTNINGFTGAVGLSLSSPPSGVTAQLATGSAPATSQLTLTATSAATLTGAKAPASMTITATGSGVTTQTFPLNVIVNPPLTGGVGTVVDLASDYNTYAFFTDAVGYPTLNPAHSLDNAGDVYSANQLNPPDLSPMALDLNGAQFNFGLANQANAVYGTASNPIALPSGSFNQLQLLGTAFGGVQKSQTLTVTYTDNTTQTLTQTFDDWSTGPTCPSPTTCTPGESVAVTMPYVHTEYEYPRNDTIYYLYGYSFALNAGKTVKSVALPNNRNVVVLAATLVNVTATPTFSLAAGTITSPQSVTLADATSGATLYYTTDGSIPTTSSSVYSGALTISATETVQAIAVASGDVPSAVASATYTLAPPAAAPTFSPGAGTYSSPPSVTLTSSTTGATIYYTTDGSTPTTSSTVYKSPITVSSSETLNAIALATNYSQSPTATAAYTIPPNFSVSASTVTIIPGATTGNASTLTFTPWGGFTGVINLSCTITPAAPTDPATCTVPATLTLSGTAAQTAVLTVNTTSATSAQNQPAKVYLPPAGGTALACLLLACLPALRRRRWPTLLALVVSCAIAGGVLGCGGGGSGGGSGGGGTGGNSGTTPGTYVLTVTATSGSITQQGTGSLVVQ